VSALKSFSANKADDDKNDEADNNSEADEYAGRCECQTLPMPGNANARRCECRAMLMPLMLILANGDVGRCHLSEPTSVA
jgi:hypothetical protein